MSTWAQIGPRSRSAVQLLTDAAPSGTGDGISLEGVGAVLAILHAPAGQTFTGVGTLLGYVYSPIATGGAAWSRSAKHDTDLSDIAGLSDGPIGVFPVQSPTGRFALVPSGVGLSGAGTAITTDYVLTSIRGESL